MIDRLTFAKGLGRLASYCRQPLDDMTVETYFDAFDGQVEARWWDAFTLEAIRVTVWPWRTDDGRTFFPSVQQTRDGYHEFVARHRPALTGYAGPCPTCDGTGFERFQREGRSFVRRCVCRPAAVSA